MSDVLAMILEVAEDQGMLNDPIVYGEFIDALKQLEKDCDEAEYEPSGKMEKQMVDLINAKNDYEAELEKANASNGAVSVDDEDEDSDDDSALDDDDSSDEDDDDLDDDDDDDILDDDDDSDDDDVLDDDDDDDEDED